MGMQVMSEHQTWFALVISSPLKESGGGRKLFPGSDSGAAAMTDGLPISSFSGIALILLYLPRLVKTRTHRIFLSHIQATQYIFIESSYALSRCPLTQAAVPSLRIVFFHKGSDDLLCLGKVLEPVMPDAFFLYRADDPLGNRIAPGIADTGEGRIETRPLGLVHKEVRGIPRSVVKFQVQCRG